MELQIKEEYGSIICDHHIVGKIVSKALEISKNLPIGGELIIDFKGVQLFSPVILLNVIRELKEKQKSQKMRHRILLGCFVVVKDPNDDVLELLDLCSKKLNISILVVYTNQKRIVSRRVLNLPPFLEKTLDIINQHGPMSSAEMEERLGEEKGASARERLRLLFRSGLVKRKAVAPAFEGRPFFMYESFPDILG